MKTIATVLLLLSFSYLSIGQSESALREKLSAKPNDPVINYDLGIWLQNDKKYSESTKYLTVACKLDTNKSDYPYNLAREFELFIKNVDSAMYWYKESGKRFSRNNEKTYDNGWRKLLELSGEAGNADYYIEAYDQLLKIDSRLEFNYSAKEKYDLLKEQRDHPTASTFIKIGDEKTKKIQFNESLSTYRIRFDQGLKAYEKAIQMDPIQKESVTKKMGAAMVDDAYYGYFEQGDYEEALKRYDAAAKYAPKNPEIFSSVGIIKMDKLKTPDYKGAIASFQKALNLTNSASVKRQLYEYIGSCYDKQKDYSNAITNYELGIKQEPNFAKSIHAKLTKVYEAMGNKAKADYHRLRS